MVESVIVKPDSAAAAGCAASFSLIDSFPDEGYGWWKQWEFLAQAADGWIFDHWEQTYRYQDVDKDGPSVSGAVCTARNNPWHHGSSSQEGTEEWYDDSWSSYSAYRTTFRYIDGVIAHFRPLPTGLILRSASSGAILHGASSTILHDA